MKAKVIMLLWVLIAFSLSLILVIPSALAQAETLTDSDGLVYYSNPSNYIDKKVNFTGKILTLLPPSSGTLGLQMYQAGDTNRNTIVVYSAPILFSKDDCVRVIGVTKPVTEYQNMFGARLSAAAIEAESINKIECSESIEPARKTVNVDETQEINNIKVTLHKVEFSDKNTRAYLTIENTNLSEDIIFYDFNSKAIQGKTQFITTNSYDVDYPKIESTIPAGIEEKGVVLFEPLNPSESQAQFRFEVRDPSYYNIKFIFDIILSPLEFYDKILDSNPEDKIALNNKGFALFDLGNYTQAIEFFDRVLTIDPNDILALNNKGISLFILGNNTGAIKFYDRVLKTDPDDVKALVGKGEALVELGNITGAMEFIDKALAIDPDNLRALFAKGWVLVYLEDYKGAMEFIDKALAIDPENDNLLELKTIGEQL